MPDRPNILFIMTDQQRFDATGCCGSEISRTPHTDALAESGVNFVKHYSSVGICSPARASLLTGLWAHNHRMLNNTHAKDSVCPELRDEVPTISEALSRGGYRCGYIGKWHIGSAAKAAERGFADTEYIEGRGFGEYLRSTGFGQELTDPVGRVRRGRDMPWAAITNARGDQLRPAFLASRTIEALERYKRDDAQPFFLVCSFEGPHFPCYVPPEWAARYDPETIPPWGNFDETFEGKPRSHWRYAVLRNGIDAPWEQWRVYVARYFALTSLIDHEIGRILAALDGLGMSDDTLVVFTTDHGDLSGSHKIFNKGAIMYEELYRIPLVMRWPGVSQQGAVCEAYVSAIDVPATLLEAAGVEALGSRDGRSLASWLCGEQPDWPDSIYSQFHGDEYSLCSLRMVRDDDWKYVYYPDGLDELYDERADPFELRNLAEDADYADPLRQMKDRLAEWMERVGDPLLRWNFDLR
ncbi:MAG: sulfatase-like hydrolase/transferase [Armatimonadota bacterium]|nr:MAG: sulfatase-like hydrolase/transferase [Armatimonadota bacterium]